MSKEFIHFLTRKDPVLGRFIKKYDPVLVAPNNRITLFVSLLNGSCLSPISVLCCETLSGIQISARVLSQGGDEQIFREIQSSFENIHDDIILLADEFLYNDAHNMILR